MKYVSAYLLATLGGNESPSAKDIEKILGSVGLDVDMQNANAVVDALKGKSVNEVINSGKSKLASVPAGGAAPAAATGSAPADAAPAAKSAPEKKEEKEESEDEDMGFGLFD